MCFTYQQLCLKSENLRGHKADFCRQYCLMLVFKETWCILRFFFLSINQRGCRKGVLFLFFSTPDCAFEGLPEYLPKKCLLPTCSGPQKARIYYFARCNYLVTNPACCVAVGIGRHHKMFPENV